MEQAPSKRLAAGSSPAGALHAPVISTANWSIYAGQAPILTPEWTAQTRKDQSWESHDVRLPLAETGPLRLVVPHVSHGLSSHQRILRPGQHRFTLPSAASSNTSVTRLGAGRRGWGGPPSRAMTAGANHR